MSNLNKSVEDMMKTVANLQVSDNGITEEAFDDIQENLSTQLADELMAIIGYDEARPNIEDQIKDFISDSYNLEER